MLVLPRTVAFKTSHNVFFRRLHFCESVTLVRDEGGLLYYEVSKLNGAKAYIPYTNTVLLVGKKVSVIK